MHGRETTAIQTFSAQNFQEFLSIEDASLNEIYCLLEVTNDILVILFIISKDCLPQMCDKKLSCMHPDLWGELFVSNENKRRIMKR